MEKFHDGCPGKIEVPTKREREALDALRSIKARVRELKRKISAQTSAGHDEDSGQRKLFQDELNRLKAEWESWQQKRLSAEKERMILLGHENAEQSP